jgi:hypothetical protein
MKNPFLDIWGMDTQTGLFIVFVSSFLSIWLTNVFLRWIFSVKSQLWNQKQQIALLIKIARTGKYRPSKQRKP